VAKKHIFIEDFPPSKQNRLFVCIFVGTNIKINIIMSTQAQSTTQWNLDPTHSEVQFKVKHLVISTVTGSFNQFTAAATTHGDSWENAQINFSADINSIDTNNEQRDGHLKSGDFFDAENHPTLNFVSTSFTKKSDNQFALVGDLTLKGTTKSVTLNTEFGGEMVDPYGNHKAGFEVSGEINREEFGLTWSAVTEAGGVVVGANVKLHMNIQLVKG
jgi:polyisoprenoid-binding protein YceI